MKHLQFLLLTLICWCSNAKADSLWLETEANGQMGKPQKIKVIFGSYNQYRLQKVNAEFKEVKDFTCWIVSPSGKKYYPRFTPTDTSYESMFTPDENGVYTILLENKQRKVEDWRNSSTKIGIAKQHYYARTTIQVGNNNLIAKDNQTDLSLIADRGDTHSRDIHLQVLLHGKPVKDAVIFMRLPQMKEQKKVTTEAGEAIFTAPGPGRYFFLVTLKFDSPGTYKGISYDVFREKSTLTTVID